MGAYYDEVEIEDMAWDEEKGVFHYPCPCGDRFEISRQQLAEYEDIATCPSCSLIIRVVYDPLDYQDDPSEDEDSPTSEDDEDEEEGESDEDEDEERFEDALERLHISEQPPAFAASA